MIDLASHYDVVIGSRYVDGRVTVSNWPMSRLLVSYFGSWYARTITGMPVRDATGGFICWHRGCSRPSTSPVQSNGYAFQIELKYRAYRRGFSLVEIPILFTERDSGESKMSKKIVREAIWRVWWLRIQAISRDGYEPKPIDRDYYDSSDYFEGQGAGTSSTSTALSSATASTRCSRSTIRPPVTGWWTSDAVGGPSRSRWRSAASR
jgi:hypothetical protein